MSRLASAVGDFEGRSQAEDAGPMGGWGTQNLSRIPRPVGSGGAVISGHKQFTLTDCNQGPMLATVNHLIGDKERH